MNEKYLIQAYRNKLGLSIDELASSIGLDTSTITKWESGEEEPSINSQRKMCTLFNCTLDDLMGYGEDKVEKPVASKETLVLKSPLASCAECSRFIYEESDLKTINETYSVRAGRGHINKTRQKVLCNSCYERYLAEEKRRKEEERAQFLANAKKRRIHSFVWSTLVAAIFIALAVTFFTRGNANFGYASIAIALMAYCFVSTMILDNTFIPDFWLEVSSWGFIKLPGIIFGFDLDGLIAFITIKLVFFLLGMALAIASVVAATLLALPLSVFAYPFALKKNLSGEE